MASFLPRPSTSSTMFTSSYLTANNIHNSSFFSNSSVAVALRTKNSTPKVIKVAVKAMGGAAKFKGTRMREKQLTEMIEKKVVEAKEVCQEDETSDECKVAWDEVEEVSQAKADLRRKLELEKQDPLEYYCQDNPETDECRIYED